MVTPPYQTRSLSFVFYNLPVITAPMSDGIDQAALSLPYAAP